MGLAFEQIFEGAGFSPSMEITPWTCWMVERSSGDNRPVRWSGRISKSSIRPQESCAMVRESSSGSVVSMVRCLVGEVIFMYVNRIEVDVDVWCP